MAERHSSSWRRTAISTLAWALALLLLTNIAWSWWFSQHFAAAYEARWRAQLGLIILESPTRIESNGQCQSSIYLDDSSGSRLGWFSRYNSVTTPEGEGVDYRALRSHGLIEHTVPGWVKPTRLRTRTNLSRGEREAEMFAATGWPLRLLWCRFDCGDGGFGAAVAPDTSTAIVVRDAQQRSSYSIASVMPFRPVWTGQLAYGSFWVAVVALFRMAWYVMRRGWRSCRGRCADCAYDLRGNVSGVCPECGAAAPESTGERRNESGAA